MKQRYFVIVEVDQEQLDRIGHTAESAVQINHPAVTVLSVQPDQPTEEAKSDEDV